MPAADECVECTASKTQAEAKEAATSKDDGLQLRECAPLYRKWADCVRDEKGQAKACVAVLEEFKACHSQLGAKR